MFSGRGLYVVCTWSVRGLYVVRTWLVRGSYVVRTWFVGDENVDCNDVFIKIDLFSWHVLYEFVVLGVLLV